MFFSKILDIRLHYYVLEIIVLINPVLVDVLLFL